ncbi:MAG: hypothetical protein ACM3Q1_02575 [Bacteroidales bacterium]
MRAILLPLLLAALLGGCYEVSTPVVSQGARAEMVKEGRWRRSDGSELVLTWDAAAHAYRVAAGGMVRLEPVGQLWLADYQAERNVVLLARIAPEQVLLYVPSPAAEKRLAAAHGLSVRPGPVNRLNGDAGETRRYLTDLARLDSSGELVVAERLEWLGPG